MILILKHSMYLCLYTLSHTHAHSRTNTHTHTYIHTQIPMQIHTQIHTPTLTYIHRYSRHTHTPTPTHTYTRTHTHAHTHTHTHTYTHTPCNLGIWRKVPWCNAELAQFNGVYVFHACDYVVVVMGYLCVWGGGVNMGAELLGGVNGGYDGDGVI